MSLERDDWSGFVDRAVDALLEELAEEPITSWTRDLLEDRRTQAAIRNRLFQYTTMVMAAAATRAGNLRRNDGGSTVDCDFILRPHNTPYFRCTGHSPSHCYDMSYHVIGCP